MESVQEAVNREQQEWISGMIDGLVEKARGALEKFMSLGQEDVDKIVKAMALAGLDKHMELALSLIHI